MTDGQEVRVRYSFEAIPSAPWPNGDTIHDLASMFMSTGSHDLDDEAHRRSAGRMIVQRNALLRKIFGKTPRDRKRRADERERLAIRARGMLMEEHAWHAQEGHGGDESP